MQHLTKRCRSLGKCLQSVSGAHSSSDGLPPHWAPLGGAALGLLAAPALAGFGFSARRARFGGFPATGTCGAQPSCSGSLLLISAR